MRPDAYGRLRSLFLQAIALPAGERAGRLDALCGGDASLRTELLSLLAEHERTGTFLGSPFADDRVGADATPRPHRIGHYAILDTLGEGGMGIVYLAEQENPKRTVALKVIRPGAASPRGLKRFEHEAQLLGRLHHPGIAQIFEAGSADAGYGPQPFFAMELVHGSAITEHARARRLGNGQRLELLAQVCDAVHHAHQKGVIHCDLKPGNILVDDAGQPKVLDFGVARATDSDVRATTLRTGVAQLIGTVPYMSPEQTAADPDRLDIRSDVYSLGVIGYELLTGALPHDLDGVGVLEAVRIIRERDPRRLSTVDRVFRGDVETIVGKALEKDPARRYQSAHDLALDLRRHLRSEPITARPASTIYQLRKFAARNRALVAGVLATFAALVAGIVSTGILLVRARAGEERANASAALAAKANAFLQRTIFAVDPHRTGTETRIVDVLRNAANDVAVTFADEPLVRADVQTTLGATFLRLGLTAEAGEVLRPALQVRSELLGDGDPDTSATRSYLALVERAEGSYSEAEVRLRKAWADNAREFGDEHPHTLDAMHNLAEVVGDQGRVQEAEDLYRRVLAIRMRTVGEDDVETLATQSNLAYLMMSRGAFDAAEPVLRRILEVRTRVQGAEHPDRLVALNNLAQLLVRRGRLVEAEPLFRDALAQQTRVLGEDNADTLFTAANLGKLLQKLDRLDEAEAAFRRVLGLRAASLGEDHVQTAQTRASLASVLVARGNLAEAEELLRKALAVYRQERGDGDGETQAVLQHLAGVLQRRAGPSEEAAGLLAAVVAARLQAPGPEHQDTLKAMYGLALADDALGRREDARALLADAVAGFRKALGDGDANTVNAVYSLGWVELEGDRAAAAVPLLRDAVARAAAVREEPKRLLMRATLARALQRAGAAAEAEELFAALVRDLDPSAWPAEPQAAKWLQRTAALLLEAGKADAAGPLCARLVAIGAAMPELPAFRRTQAECLLQLARFDQAEAILLELAPAGGKQVLEQLARLYDAWQRPEKAAAVRSRM